MIEYFFLYRLFSFGSARDAWKEREMLVVKGCCR